MNVLHVLDHSLPVHSGYAFRTQELLKTLAEMGYTIAARTGPKHNDTTESQDSNSGISYQRSPYSIPLSSSIPILNQLEVIRILRRDICKIDATRPLDVIHAHSPALNGVAAIWAGKLKSIPVVYEMRASWEDAAVDHGTTKPNGLRYKLTRALETWVLRHAGAVTTICEGLKDNICARGVSEEKVTVVPNAVDTTRFKPLPESRAALKQKFDAQDRFVIAFCGSFYSYEGLDFLIETMSEFVNRFPRSLVLLAGGGDQEERLKMQVQSLQLDDHVRFLGRVTQDVVLDLYNLSDVCVFPRHKIKLTDMVTPLKPLEAMATGAVVLASDVGGHKELISDGDTGLLFEADNSRSLFNMLAEIHSKPNCTDLRNAARAFVLDQRTWSASSARYGDVYRRVASGRT